MSSNWCLRFLNGALKGRTIALKPGSNTLGSASGCEVMLPAGEAAPRHVVVHAGELVVSVQKVDGAAARLNGEDLPAQRKTVLPGDILAIGQIDLELDRHVAEADDPMFVWSESALSDDDGPRAPTPVAPARPGRHIGAIAAVVVALAAAGALAAWRGGADGAAREATAPSPGEIQSLLAAYPEVEVVAGSGGQLVLKGYVESRPRQQALAQVMRPFGAHVVVAVHPADEMVEQARRFIAEPGIAFTYAGRGQLVVSGASDDDTLRRKIRRLAEDLHPSVLVTDKVQYRAPPPGRRADAPNAWSAWQEILPARMVSITTEDASGMRHIQLANGTRYYEGAVLRSGAELQAIDVDGLTIDAGTSGRRDDGARAAPARAPREEDFTRRPAAGG
ncbi:MAG TPA: forkhead-associated protein [Albitalea sp.]|uniref:forkhead-associated protein n=1 Tax=Piscinibacter sp. TaxID=1903157 RepID=UPI002ED24C17